MTFKGFSLSSFWRKLKRSFNGTLVKSETTSKLINLKSLVSKGIAFNFSIKSVLFLICEDETVPSKGLNKSTNHFAKLFVFNSLFLRAYRVSSPEFLDCELDKIYSIGSNLKYPKTFLNKCHISAKGCFYETKENINLKEKTSSIFRTTLILIKLMFYLKSSISMSYLIIKIVKKISW